VNGHSTLVQCGEDFRRGPESQRGVRNANDVRPPGDFDLADAVMPGLSSMRSLATSTIVAYVVTFETTVGCSRTCATVPAKRLPGKASTVTSVCWPTWTLAMSLSSTAALTRIFARSPTIRNSVGDDRLAATV
jgi:hypothetical protein